jgi:magnesium transporter
MGQFLHIAVIMMRDQATIKEVITEHVHLILGANYVLSIQEGAEGDVFDGVRAKLRNNVGGVRKKQADYLIYALLEAVIDSYFIILEDVGEEVEDLQDEMLENPSVRLLKQVRDLKRSARFLRRSVWPLREVLSELERADSPLINDANNLFFRRAYEHTIQVMDIAESARDVLSDMLDIYLSSVSNRLNQVMKTLTIITTIFMPLSFIAGLYGMNFHFMPELGWRFGYPLILAVMVVIVMIMLVFFRRKEWL